jgi:hypothetical protein
MSAPLSVVPAADPEGPRVGLSPDLASVFPSPLGAQKRWTTWDLRPNKKPGGKPAKVPRSPSNDPTTWKSQPEALGAAAGHAGVGFQMLGAPGVVGIDIDHCIDAAGKFNEVATKILAALPDTYAEITPSGTGLRLFCSRAEGQEVPEFLNRDAGLECYVGKSARYLTVTGSVLPGRASKYAPITEAALQLLTPHAKSAAPSKAKPSPLPEFQKLPPEEYDEMLALTGAQGEELTLIEDGLPAGERSEMVHGLILRLRDAGQAPDKVYQFLITSPGLWDYGLSKREGNPAHAQAFLWAEVNKAFSKGAKGAEGGTPKPTLAEALAGLNERYFVADEQGKMFVCTLQPDADRKNREVLVRYTFRAFCDKFQRQTALKQVQKEWRNVEIGREWLKWLHGRQFERITFDPQGNTPPDVFNLWRGWAVEPQAGDWSVLRSHIERVICSGSPDLTRYVLGWLAFMVQRPWERPGTALILRGKEGAGKSIFGEAVRNLAGAHSMAVSNAKHLVGNFNQHLRNCLVLQADEAIFAGNHEHASILKALITDPDLIIEGKGINALLARNHLHVIMTSNEEWVVPAGLEARRFVVLDVSEVHRGDFKYFAALSAAIKDDRVLAALLHDLQKWPLDGFEVRTVPDTAGLRDQKVRSLGGLNGWLVDLLTAGELPPDRQGFHPDGWHPFFQTNELHTSYEAWVGSHRRGDRTLSNNIFGKELQRIFFWHRRAPAHEGSMGKEAPGYHFGTLAEAREQFCRKTGLPASIFDCPQIDPLS